MRGLVYSILISFFLLAGTSSIGQTIVDTVAQNKKAVLEAYRGPLTPFGGFADMISDTLRDKDTTRFTIINIYEGSFAGPRSSGGYYYPDYRTSFGPTIQNQAGIQFWPAGSMNRRIYPHIDTARTALGRQFWDTTRTIILSEPSPVNVGVQASYNSQTNKITATVEIYFTDTISDSLFVNLGFKQNNVIGPQNGDTSYHPARYGANIGIYRHDNMLRHLVTGQWGEYLDSIAYIKGTFWTRTYTWTVPDSVAEVPVVVQDLDVFAFVTESRQPIITGVSNPVSVSSVSPMSGTYTIGGASPDYTTINAAVSDLESRGVSGAVTFNIRQGTYIEQILIDSVPGTSSSNRIVFKSDPANSTLPIVTNNSDFVLRIGEGARFIEFNGLELKMTANGNVVRMGDRNYNITLHNCRLIGNSSTLNTEANAVILDTNGATTYNLKISNCKIFNGYASIYISGDSGNDDKGFVIKGNECRNFRRFGAFLEYSRNAWIDSNTIVSSSTNAHSLATGIYLDFNDSVHVTSNRILISKGNNVRGIYFQRTIGTASHRQLVANNMVSITDTVGTSTHLNYFFGSSYTDVLNNSFYGAFDITSTAVVALNFGAFNTFKNNCIVNVGNGYPLYNSGAYELSNNNYFGKVYSSVHGPGSQDTNSIQFNPNYESDTNLRASNNALVGAGVYSSLVLYDIDNQLRKNPPCIGANEFDLGPMSGLYTIGGVSPDFQTISEAVDSLKSLGINGAVIFNIRQGTYNEQFVIDSIPGASASNTITFQSDPNNTSRPLISFAGGSNNNYVVQFDGADFVTFHNLNFKATGSFYSRLLYFTGYSEHLTIDSCKLETTNDVYHIALFGGGDTNVHQYTTINNCEVYCSGAGFVFTSNVNSVVNDLGIKITNNHVYNVDYDWAIRITDHDTVLVQNNYLDFDSAGTSQTGISLFRVSGFQILKNRIQTFTSGASTGIFLNGVGGSPRNVINNSYLNKTTNSSDEIGLEMPAASSVNVFYNTFWVRSSTSVGIELGGNNNDLRNNNLVNTGGDIAIKFNSSPSGTYSDFNNLYSSGFHVATYNGAKQTLQTWTSITNGDSNSVSYDPHFLANDSLVPNNGLLNNSGTPISGITKDLNGTTRNSTTPDIGAYEFTGVTPPLAGVYTIGGTSPDFVSMDSAFLALKSRGVSDTVEFHIRSGTYAQHAVLSAFSGMGNGNTVRFRNDPTTSGKVILKPTDTAGLNYVVWLNGVSNIEFLNLEFDTNNTSKNRHLVMVGVCDSIWVDSCRFNGKADLCIQARGSAGDTISYFTLSNSVIHKKSGSGIYMGEGVRNTFTNDSIIGYGINGGYAIEFENRTNEYLTFTNNYIESSESYNVSSADLYGMKFNYGGNYGTIANNRIVIHAAGKNDVYGIWCRFEDVNMYNNTIQVTGKASGIVRSFLAASVLRRTKVYFNTFFLDVTTLTGGSSSQHRTFVGGAGNGNILRNNIFVNLGESGVAYALGNGNGTTVTDYNNIYAPSQSLSAWQAANSGYDTNSDSLNPRLREDTALVPRIPDLETSGISISGYTTDIDGKTRASSPSVGAYEYTYVCDGLSGTYTIGGTSPDYTSISSAVADLNSKGICGDVTFKIRQGTYTGHYELSEIYNSPDSGWVTFQSDPLNTSDVWIVDSLSSTQLTMFNFENVQRFKFLNLKFKTLSVAPGIAIMKFNGVDNHYFLFDSCQFYGAPNGGSGLSCPQGEALTHTTISNCYFQDGGPSISNFRSTTPADSVFIVNNFCRNSNIGVSNNDRAWIQDNTLIGGYLHTTNNYNLAISGNHIQSATGTKGMFLWGTINSTIVNNVIVADGVEGIYYNGLNSQFYFNSVLNKNSGVALSYYGSSSILKNNMFVGHNDALSIQGDSSKIVGSAFDNNVYYTDRDSLGYLGSWNTPIISLSDLKTLGIDSSSYEINPNFQSDTLLIPNSPLLDSGGIAISGITKDINDVTRSNPPDIGAYEFNYVPLTVQISANDSAKCQGDTIELYASANFNATYEWLINGDSLGLTEDTIRVTKSGNYSVIANFGSLSDTSMVLPIVVSNPEVLFAITDSNYCVGDSSWGIRALGSGGVHGTRAGPIDTLDFDAFGADIHPATYQTYFQVHKPNLRLNSLTIYPETAGFFKIILFDKNNNALDSSAVQATSDAKLRVNLGFDLPVDSGLYLKITPSTARFIRSFGMSGAYPQTDAKGFVTITGNSNTVNGGDKWYHFYDWDISQKRYTYNWQGLGSTQQQLNLPSDTYLVTVTDTTFCSSSASIVLNDPVGISLIDTVHNETCNGSGDGRVLVTASGAYPPFSYLWSNNDSTREADSLASGWHSLTVTDSRGCTYVDSFSVGIISNMVLGFVNQDVSCFGFSDGIINLGVAGGLSPYTYFWNDSATTQDRAGISAGTYHVVVTDTLGCEVSDSAIISQPPLPPQIVGFASDDTICLGDSITLTAIGGDTTGTPYQWNNGVSNGVAFAPTATRNYILTGRDTNNCFGKDTLRIVVDSLPTVGLGPDFGLCANESTTLNANLRIGYTYLWSNASTSDSLIIDTAGTYWARIIDLNLCSATDTVLVSEDSVPVPALPIDDSICAGNSFILSAVSNNSYGYSWSNTESTQSITISDSGDYSVIVTDQNQCSGYDTFHLSVIALPVVSFTSSIPDQCENGLPDTLTEGSPSGGNFVGTYTGSQIVNNVLYPDFLNPGNYPIRYTVVDTGNKLNCTNFLDTSVIVHALPLVKLSAIQSMCINEGLDTITEHNPKPAQGIFGYFYLTDPAIDSALVEDTLGVFDPLKSGAGTHDIYYTFTDSNGCADTANTSILVKDTTFMSFTASLDFCVNDTTFQLLEADSVPSGKFGTYTGMGIRTGSRFDPKLAGSGSHILRYRYRNAQSCVSTTYRTAQVDTLPQVSFIIEDTCQNSPAIVLNEATPSGGTYYNSVQGIISGDSLDPALYSIGQHELNYWYEDLSTACRDTVSSNFTIFPAPTVSFALPDTAKERCIDAVPVTLTGYSPIGGWFTGNGLDSTGLNFLSGFAGVDTHKITYHYTDQNYCTDSIADTIIVHGLPVVEISYLDSICTNALPDTVFGGTPLGGSYSGFGVDTNGIFRASLVGAGGGKTITYTYSDTATGCVNFAIDTFRVDTVTPIFMSLVPDICLNAGIDTFDQASINTGNFIYESNGSVNGTLYDPRMAGVGTDTVKYTFTNDFGCKDSIIQTFEVHAVPIVSIRIPSGKQRVCDNSAPFALSFGSPSGGNWKPDSGIASNSFNPANARRGLNTLIYTYTDTNNCTNKDTSSILVNVSPIVDFPGDTLCINEGNLVMQTGTPISGAGGSGKYSGQGVVNDSIFSPVVASLGNNLITYTYVDTNGCSNNAQANVRVNNIPLVNFAQPAPICGNKDTFRLQGASSSGNVSYFLGRGIIDSLGTYVAARAGFGLDTISYVGVHANTGCSDTVARVARIDTVPIVSMDTMPNLCEGAAIITLNSGLPRINGRGVYSGTGVIGSRFFPTLAGVGTHIISYRFTDNNNCSDVITDTFRIHPKPVMTAPVTPLLCVGSDSLDLLDTNSVALATPIGGQYSGSFVDSTGKFAPDSVGNWTLNYTYTDSNNCSNSVQHTLEVKALPIVGLIFDSTICENAGQVLLQGGSPLGARGVYKGQGVRGNFYIADSLSSLRDTLWYVYEDVNGCRDSASQSIRVDTLGPITMNQIPFICEGQDPIKLDSYVSPSGGTFKGSSIVNNTFYPALLSRGAYLFEYDYVDSNGCLNILIDTLSVSPLPSISVTRDTAICKGSPVTLKASGGLSYTWSTADRSADITVSPRLTQSYSVTVTNEFNCQRSAQTKVIVNDNVILFTTSTNSTCGKADGVGYISVSRGKSPFNYYWSNGGRNSSERNLKSGTYYVTVTDANSCEELATVNITDKGAPSISIGAIVHNDCFGGESGSIQATASGGSGSLNYSWSSGQTTANISGLKAGKYDLRVIDDGGCKSFTTVQVNEGSEIKVEGEVTPPDCDSLNGKINVNVVGGAKPYSYNWLSGGSSDSIVSIGTGTYDLVLTDGKSCADTFRFSVSNENAPEVRLDSILSASCGSSDGGIYVSPRGTIDSYLWSRGDTTEDLSSASYGNYVLTAMDTFNCKRVETFEIPKSTPEAVEICYVTVDQSSRRNLIAWDTTGVQGVSAFNVYRQSSVRGKYFRIGSVAAGGSSEFIDQMLDNSTIIGNYQVKGENQCGEEGNSGGAHEAILASVLVLNDSVTQVDWSIYGGLTVDKYYIYRYSSDQGSRLIDSLFHPNRTYIDYNAPLREEVVYYYITAKNTSKCAGQLPLLASNYTRDVGRKTVGIDKLSQVDYSYKVWPNPNNGEFNLQLSGRSDLPILIRVFDSQGRLHYEKTQQELQQTVVYSLKLSDISDGVYYLQLVDQTKVNTTQIVVNR